MSAEQRAIYRIMTEHEYMLNLKTGAICACGFVPVIDPETLTTQQEHHRGHLASVLASRYETAPKR